MLLDEGARAYLGTRPSKKSIGRTIAEISAETIRKTTWLPAEEVVARLNRKLNGWANYFSLGPVSKAYRAINAHTTARLRRWLCEKHNGQGTGRSRYPDTYLHEKLGLVHLPSLTRSFPWAKA